MRLSVVLTWVLTHFQPPEVIRAALTPAHLRVMRQLAGGARTLPAGQQGALADLQRWGLVRGGKRPQLTWRGWQQLRAEDDDDWSD